MAEISDELTQLPAGKTLQKALQAVAGLPKMSQVLFALQAELLPRIRSRQQEFTPSDEALACFTDAETSPHIISLARSHSWYEPALKTGFRPEREYTLSDLHREARRQLQIRQGITAEDDQFDVVGFSTITLARAIIRTTPQGKAVLGDTVAWDGYAMPPAMEQRVFLTKPADMLWSEFIAANFKNPKEEVGTIFVTSPDSITGRYTAPEVLQDLLDIADKYGVKVVLNQIHAVPDRNGNLPEPQTSMIANSKSPTLITMSAATKQLMPDALPETKEMMFNTFYSPDPNIIAEVRKEILNPLPASMKGDIVTKRVIGPATALMKASGTEFYAANEQKSFERRRIVEDWLSQHAGINWYRGEKPQTIYHAAMTLSPELVGKTGIKNPEDLYKYVLFNTGLDIGPIFDKGPDGDYSKTGVSMRLNYSLPEKELRLSLALLDVAVDKMKRGVTLEQVVETAIRESDIKLKVDTNPPPKTQTELKP